MRNEMATISAAVIRSTIEVLLQADIARHTIETTIGMSLSQLQDDDRRIPMSTLVHLERAMPRLSANPALALQLGQHCGGVGSQSGVVGHLAASSATIGDGFRQAIRYSNLLSTVIQIELREHAGLSTFVYMRKPSAYATRSGIELALSTACTTLNTLGGHAHVVQSASFQYPAPAYIAEYSKMK